MPAMPSGTLQGPPDEELDPFEPRLERPISRRFLLFKGGLLAGFGALAVRLWQMQIAEGRQYATLAEQNRVDVRPVKAPRGVLYDRNGIVLAGNKANWSITIIPANLPKEETARQAVFAELNQRLAPPWVLIIEPSKVPEHAVDDIYGRVAQALGRPADEIRTQVDAFIAEEQLPVLTDDLPVAEVPAVQKALAGLPGVTLMSRPEFRVWSNPADPRLPVVVHEDIPRDLALTIESRSVLLPGVGIQPQPGRAYPSGTLAAHILGYVGRIDPETQTQAMGQNGQPIYESDDNIGRAGMEAVLEPILRGRKGFHIVEVDSNRRIVHELSSQPPAPGASAALTVDLGLQKEATDALNEQLLRAGAAAGAVVALDPATGEVLAMASVPTFNSQAFSDGLSQRDYQAILNDKNLPLFNRCIGGAYTPGGSYKPFVALAALREKVVDGGTTHVCKGGVHVPAGYNEISRTFYRCSKPEGHGPLTLVGGLAQSCNVFFFNLVVPAVPDERGKNLRYYEAEVGGTPIEFKGLGIERVNAMAQAFGFGKMTGIELAGEVPGLLPNPEWKRELGDRGTWTVGDTINNGIGLGDVQVTPLQMATAMAAIANGGTLYQPRLLKSILHDDNQTIEERTPIVAGKLEIEREQIELVREGLRAVAREGVAANRVTVPDIDVAGMASTAAGTATIAPEEDLPRQPHAWYVGFAPYDQPRLVVAVLLERAGDGASLAAPVAERVMRAFFSRQ